MQFSCQLRNGYSPAANCRLSARADYRIRAHSIWSVYEPRLVQARAAQAIQIMLPVGVILDRHLVCDPGERNIGLRTAKLAQRGPGNIGPVGNRAGCLAEGQELIVRTCCWATVSGRKYRISKPRHLKIVF
jgi:hypothetical protein